MRKNIFYFLLIIATIVGGIFFVYKEEKPNTYIPPNECTVYVEVKGDGAYMNVTGLNSTVFCRRVIDVFNEESDKIVAINVEDYPDGLPLCEIQSDDKTFNVRVISGGDFGRYICGIFSNGIAS